MIRMVLKEVGGRELTFMGTFSVLEHLANIN